MSTHPAMSTIVPHVRSWAFLKYDETSPLGAKDSMLSLMSRGHAVAADSDIESGPEVSRETYIFVRRHNLASGIEGLYLPTLSLLREGWKIWVASLNVTRKTSKIWRPRPSLKRPRDSSKIDRRWISGGAAGSEAEDCRVIRS
jgi:hypothetical protein